MSYISVIRAEQVGRGPTTATIRVHWTFGILVPEVLQITKPIDGMTPPILLASVQIDKSTKKPTSVDIQILAPDILSIAVAPRILKNGYLADRMPDESGVSQYWESFIIQTSLFSVAPEPLPDAAPQAPRPPRNLRAEVTQGQFIVSWQAVESRHFNIRDVPSARDQIELPGSARTYTERRVVAGRYRFSIQACNTIWSLTNRSICSEWVAMEVVVPPELGYHLSQEWELLDNNPATKQIVAGGGNLYQMHGNGKIWKYTGTPLTGWQELDNNPATKQIVAGGGNLYQMHGNGFVWVFTG